MKNFFTISEFARLRNININSLRYYEKIGVLTPAYVDAQTGYRYYSPDQLPILDVILLCLDVGIPLKELKAYIHDGAFIHNSELFANGKRIAQERVRRAQMELNKIEYTLNYLAVNQQYSPQAGLYERKIPKRRIVTAEYGGALPDVRKIETASARLYRYAQDRQLAPVFPAGIIVNIDGDRIAARIFFEIMAKDQSDEAIEDLPGGTFLCRQVDLRSDVRLLDTIGAVYGAEERGEIVVSNMLLDKYQIGTKKSELQKKVAT